MTNINKSAQNAAKKIANHLDGLDGTNGKIEAQTWKDNAVKKWGAKDNVRNFISVFSAQKSITTYIKREARNTEFSEVEIGDKWYGDLVSVNTDSDKSTAAPETTAIQSREKNVPTIEEPQNNPLVEQKDAVVVDDKNIKISANNDKTEHKLPNLEDKQKEQIVNNMYKKWSDKFKQSPLDKSFYNKLYDVIKTLNCSIKDTDFDNKHYSSKREQTMDEVIAIFAGEAQLNPKARNGQYKGLFQLATPGLKDLKQWAKEHPDTPGMNNIKSDIDINGFWKLSGNDQLDYLVAYIGKAKEYSKIPEAESITPAQVWAMIKYPFKGKINSNITAQKATAIKNVFKKSKIPHGATA